MKKIDVIFGKNKKVFALIDNEDFDILSKYKWYLDSKGYAYSTKRYGHGVRITKRMHRVIMNAKKGQMIDHVNHNKLDNRKENLRFCSYMQNGANIQSNKRNISGYKGVGRNYDKWRAYISKGRKFYSLGRYNHVEDAARAYDKKAKELFGEFAFINFNK